MQREETLNLSQTNLPTHRRNNLNTNNERRKTIHFERDNTLANGDEATPIKLGHWAGKMRETPFSIPRKYKRAMGRKIDKAMVSLGLSVPNSVPVHTVPNSVPVHTVHNVHNAKKFGIMGNAQKGGKKTTKKSTKKSTKKTTKTVRCTAKTKAGTRCKSTISKGKKCHRH